MPILLRFLHFLAILSLVGLSPGATLAQAGTYCGADQTPVYSFGFADLKAFVGDAMGDPVTCEYADPDGSGDVYQQTTTGTALWRAGTSISTFTSDTDHWAVTPYGSLTWSGSEPDPPAALVTALQAQSTDQTAHAQPDAPTADLAPPAAAAGPPTYATASEAAVYWGAYVGGAPPNMSVIAAFESGVGKSVSIMHWGQSWGRPPSNRFETTYFDLVRQHGAFPLIDWGSWQLGAGVDQPDFRLATIASGAYDGFIQQWAEDAARWGHPFFLRFDPEMNGWWLPWSEQLNGNAPGDFARAWRHVHDIFVQHGATNATWVWCPNVSVDRSTPMAQLYPGDEYVDWTCLDGYNFGPTNGYSWQSFGQVFGGPAFGDSTMHNSYQELLAVSPSKPIMIGELASSETGGSKGSWITDMFQTLPSAFPNIKAIVWMDWNAGDPSLTWAVGSSREAQAAFANGVAASSYASNVFGAANGGRIQPLAGKPSVASNPSVLHPIADTYISRSQPTSSAGGASATLAADQAGTDTAFLMFDLLPLAGKTITSVTLRLHTSTEAWAGSGAIFDVKLVPATNWREEYMTFHNTVPISNSTVGSTTGNERPNAWEEIALNAAAIQPLTGGRLALALTGRKSDVWVFNSREAGPDVAPQLVIGYSG